MNLEKRLERRYWLVGILCSLFFHGAVVFLPLHFARGRNVPPPSLRISLVGQASGDVVRGANAEVHPPTHGEVTTSQVPGIPPVQPPEAPASGAEGQSIPEAQPAGEDKEESPLGVAQTEEEYVLPRGTAVSAAAATVEEPISLLSDFSEEDERARDVGQGRRGPESLPPEAPQEQASDTEPTMPYRVVPQAEAAKEKERIPPGAAAVATLVPEPSVETAAAKTAAMADADTPAAGTPADQPSPGVLAGRDPEVDTPAMDRVPAPVSTRAPRQYFAPSKELFAKVHAAPGTSAAHVGGAGATVPAKSAADTAPVTGHAASGHVEEGWTSPPSQAAELKAEKIRSYQKMRYSNTAAAQSILQPQAEDNTAKQAAQEGAALEGVSPQHHAEDAAPQHGGEDVIAHHGEGASVVPDQNRPSDGAGRLAEESTPSQPEENLSFSKPGALTPQPSVADQHPPLTPPDRGKEAASAAPSGARDAGASIEPRALQFDTLETLSRRVLAALSAHKEYPPAALRRKTEGVVKLLLVVAPNGSLVRAQIQSPSGSSILDEAALRLVQSIFPLDVRLASALSLVIPVEYRIPK